MSSYIGIDIGGTKISGINIRNKEIQKRAQKDTGATRPANEILRTLFEVIREVITDDVSAIGIGVPGILNVEEGEIISINNIASFNNFKLVDPVKKEFSLPTFMNNDANCFALSEAYFGAGQGFSNIIGITLGTGVGGGLVINKKVYSGNLGAAGEFGCIPYKNALFEDYGGSKFFERDYQRSGKELFDLAEAEDQEARKAFLEYGKHLAGLLTQLIFFIAPEAIVIGGSISQAYKYFEPSIKEMLDQFFIPIIAEHVVIRQAELKDSGVLGAAALCM